MFDVKDEKGFWTSDVEAIIDFRNKPNDVSRALKVVAEVTGAYYGADGDDREVLADAIMILDFYELGLTRQELNHEVDLVWDEMDAEPPRPVETALHRAMELHPDIDPVEEASALIPSVRALLQPRDARGRFVAATKKIWYNDEAIAEIRAIREANPGMGLREAKELFDAAN